MICSMILLNFIHFRPNHPFLSPFLYECIKTCVYRFVYTIQKKDFVYTHQGLKFYCYAKRWVFSFRHQAKQLVIMLLNTLDPTDPNICEQVTRLLYVSLLGKLLGQKQMMVILGRLRPNNWVTQKPATDPVLGTITQSSGYWITGYL